MPLQYLIALFIGLPIIELVLLIKVDRLIGFGPTVLLVVLTGVVGATMVRRQGVALLFKIRQEMQRGNTPAPQMIDGIMLLIAGAFLITPGLITDTVGFALLIPFVRKAIRGWIRKKLEEKVRNSHIAIHVRGPNDL
ncbi:MAG: FxsA family protein [Pontiellaceae bacterium]|nr:FxsA family protein [Pontiellaceae bacterium]